MNYIIWMKFADRFCDRSSDKAKPDKTNGFHDVLYPFPSCINKNYVLILKEYTINVK